MIVTIKELADRLPPARQGRLMGLDLGTKTIGIALSDPGRRIATPMETWRRRRKFSQDAAHLLELAEKEGVAAIVIGLPVNMDGSIGPRAQSARAFARNLERLTDIPILLWDERLSTAGVERALLEADMSRARRAEVVDKMAAAWILQGVLDRLAQGAADGGGTAGDRPGIE